MDEEQRQVEIDATKGERLKLPCRKCTATTVHIVQTSIDVDGKYQDWLRWWQHYQIVQCQGCEEFSFRLLEQNTEDFYVDDEGETQLEDHVELYPPRVAGRAPLRDLFGIPAMVRWIYDETHKALANKQPILASVGIRSLVEAVCRQKGARGRNLEKRINSLVDLGVLTREGAEILHALRDLGNASAHEAIIHSESELGTAFDVVEHLLLGVYVLPHQAASLGRKKT